MKVSANEFYGLFCYNLCEFSESLKLLIVRREECQVSTETVQDDFFLKFSSSILLNFSICSKILQLTIEETEKYCLLCKILTAKQPSELRKLKSLHGSSTTTFLAVSGHSRTFHPQILHTDLKTSFKWRLF